MKTGIIKGFVGIPGSGIAHLRLLVTGEGLRSIPCENGPTVRALNEMFPGFIVPGHRVDPEVIIDKEIAFELDYGLLSNIAHPEDVEIDDIKV